MGSGILNMVVFLVVVGVAALQLQTSTAQTTHVVLDSLGWTIPQSGAAAAYTAWASDKNFTFGDILVFNFATNAHTVAEVTKSAFDACTTTGTLSIWNTPPVSVTLNSSGDHYYLCTIPGHCSAGQKLAINVTAARTPPPAPTPSPATTSPRSPTPSPVATTPPRSPTPSPVATPPPAAAPSPTTTPPSSPSRPSPSPSATPPAPSSTTTPSAAPPAGITAPPPPNSAASFAAAALPVTFLSVVMALFY